MFIIILDVKKILGLLCGVCILLLAALACSLYFFKNETAGWGSWKRNAGGGVGATETVNTGMALAVEEEVLEDEAPDLPPYEPELLHIFKLAYPDLSFTAEYDEKVEDWKILLGNNGKEKVFYWCNGAMLPEDQLAEKEKYWTLLYNYNYHKPLADPADFTPEQIAAMKKIGSVENRKNGAGTPMFFFDEVYDSYSRVRLESHIRTVRFLGFSVNVHERLVNKLLDVEAKILYASQQDDDVKSFLNNINRNEGYFWRVIADTNRKSFHSLGIALDIQPKSYGGKEVYWSWAREKNPDGWMLTPLKGRWMPPKAVIEIFEEEGFIWGGKWGIWDNMHFEYHPELIYFAKENEER